MNWLHRILPTRRVQRRLDPKDVMQVGPLSEMEMQRVRGIVYDAVQNGKKTIKEIADEMEKYISRRPDIRSIHKQAMKDAYMAGTGYIEYRRVLDWNRLYDISLQVIFWIAWCFIVSGLLGGWPWN